MRVLVSGYFDPIHRGHIDHMTRAAQLGDWLIVVTGTDEMIVQKNGFVVLPLRDRLTVLEAIKGVSRAVVRVGAIEDALRHYKPDIYAQGGDRTLDNVPQSEIDVCREIGCRIVCGVGGLLNSSSRIKERIRSSLQPTDLPT